MKTFFMLFAIMFCCQKNIFAQALNDSSSNRNDYLKVYLDGLFFFSDYIKTEITFVNYVRDRHDADVFVLITSQSTGSGGQDYSLFFLGQKSFEGKNDTLKYIANTNNTDDETRSGITNELKLGLLRYVASLPEASLITVTFSKPEGQTPEEAKDKWNNWVFTISANGNFNGEKSYHSTDVNGNVSADKVTDEWKLNFSAGASYHKSKYSVDSFNYTSETSSQYTNATIVKSITDHWSAGTGLGVSSSTYNNYALQAYVSPGIEFDVFPYSKSTSHLLTFLYEIIPSFNRYTDTTIYNKIQETLVSQSLSVSLVLIEKWGSINTSLSGSNYLHDFSKNSINLSGSLQWRIINGLSLQVSGSVGLVHDQLSLPKEGATEQEILTQQRLLSTNYNYYMYAGLSYTFGSIFNNVVNPRFNRSF